MKRWLGFHWNTASGVRGLPSAQISARISFNSLVKSPECKEFIFLFFLVCFVTLFNSGWRKLRSFIDISCSMLFIT